MSSRFRGVHVARMLFSLAALAGSPVGQADDAKVAAPSRHIIVRVSGEYFAPLIERPIDETLPVDEEILGVRAVGDARVQAQPVLILTDDPRRAAFTVALSGKIDSRTTGRKGPVEIRSRSATQFTAIKRVAFEPGRGFVGQPAQIETQTDSRTERILPDRGGPLGRAIERRAWLRVVQSRQAVEQIIRGKIELRIQDTFERLLAARLARVNWLAQQRLAWSIALADAKPTYSCCTSAGFLHIAASSTETACQPMTLPANPPVQVWVHENVVGDWTASLLRLCDLGRQNLGVERPAATYDLALAGDWLVVQRGRQPPDEKLAGLRAKDSQAE